MAVRWYIQSVERQNHQPKILCQTKLSLKTEGKKQIVLCPSNPQKPSPPPPLPVSPVSRRSSGGDDGYPLQYSCLENPRGAWLAVVHSVIKNQTRQKQLARHVHIVYYTCTYMFALSKNRHFQTSLAKTLQTLFQKLPNICIWQYCHFLSDLFLFSFQEDPLQHMRQRLEGEIWLIRAYWDLEFPLPVLPNFELVGGLLCKSAKSLPKVFRFCFVYFAFSIEIILNS